MRDYQNPKLVVVLLLVAQGLLPSCNLFVHVEVPEPISSPATFTAPLTQGERLRFPLSNLGEISPGVAYRSAKPDRELLEFLVDRCQLGHVINLQRGPNALEEEILHSIGGTVTYLRMSSRRPPEPRQILEMIRVTQKALEEGRSILIHCWGGADRTGMMAAIWRMLYQGMRDRTQLEQETFLHRHLSLHLPNVYQTIARFRPELFMPFIEDVSLMDDPEKVTELESQYFLGQPLLSGSTNIDKGKLRVGVGKIALLDGWAAGEEIPMATYGPLPGNARGVRRPVDARAMILEGGNLRLAMVSCDLMIIDPLLRELVVKRAKERGILFDDLLLGATHTHTSIGGYVDHGFAEFYIMGKFQRSIRDHLVDRITDALALATISMKPATLGVGRTFVENVAVNRRMGTTVDTEVGLIKIMDATGSQPMAMLVNFTGHPILEPNDGMISSDYPGILTEKLDEQFGFGFFLQGALGDINACPLHSSQTWSSKSNAELVASTIFDGVMGVADKIETRETIELGSMTYILDIPSTNVSVIPDLLFPLEILLSPLLNWPRVAFIQAIKIGPVALIACSTEISSRLGLQIKRRSPSPFPFVVTHANAYSGYAVTQYLFAKSKLDPTSVISNNGSTYGTVVVEAACKLLEVQWKKWLDPEADLISPATQTRLDEEFSDFSHSDKQARMAEAIAHEERELLVRVDNTLPQTRRTGNLVSDSVPDLIRLEFSYLYLDGLMGGDGLEGRIRDTSAQLRFRLPLEVQLGLGIGYRDSDWEPRLGEDRKGGTKDLEVHLDRPFKLISRSLQGNALRLIPKLSITAPTGDSEPFVPFAFAPATGVWRPSVGGALEFTWETYRVFVIESLYRTSTEGYQGRRPGDRWEFALGYTERHGAVSLSLDWTSVLQSTDSRNGGRLAVDVDELSFQMGLRPGLNIHIGEHVELFTQGIFPVAHGGDGAREGQGIRAGVMLGF